MAVPSLATTASADELLGEPHVYKTAADQELRLFLFKPSDWKPSDRRPAIVFFHGGGWITGSPNSFSDQSSYLATRGMVAVSVQYRLVTRESRVAPLVCIQDAKSALRWVRAHASELGIDAARIAAGGGSAGGHLALVAGLVPGFDDPADDLNVSARPAALVLFNPVVNTTEGQAEQFLEGKQTFMDASPSSHVTAAAPPMIIFHGTEDKTVPMTSVVQFQASLQKVGARCDAVFYEGRGHGFFHRESDSEGRSYYETMVAADEFLTSLGWLEGPPTLAKPSR